jgi:hypothetical protein
LEVKGDELFLYGFMKNKRRINVDEITKVEMKPNSSISLQLNVYIETKKLISVDTAYRRNLDLLLAYLEKRRGFVADNLNLDSDSEKESIVIERYLGDKILFGILIVLFVAGWIWTLLDPNSSELFENPSSIVFAQILLIAMAILSFFYLMGLLKWKVTLTQETMIVNKLFGTEKVYDRKDITEIKPMKEGGVILLSEKKKIVKIPDNCRKFLELLAWLEDKEIS